ncbi:MAG TPA: FlgD immunoglobulin-like domain containing protein, partial [Candidatus Eisenbacteria bacterium]|nr:FlgD immunoglobulin-like domain containing protein [Candidatus Eisenbacteria bacterium]
SGSVRLYLRAAGGSVANARIVDVAGREVRAWKLDVPASGSLEWSWDGTPARGGSRGGGVYFLYVEAGGVRQSLRLVLFR